MVSRIFLFLIFIHVYGIFAQQNRLWPLHEYQGRQFPARLKLHIPPDTSLSRKANQNATTAYDSLPLLMPPFLINEIEGPQGAEQWDPGGAVDSAGNTVFGWVDKRTGFNEIFVRFFDSRGNPRGGDFRISPEPNFWNARPSLAMNKDGHLVVAWAQDPYTILARRFTPDGQLLDNILTLNKIKYINTLEPSVAINDSGYFAAVWPQGIFFARDNFYGRVFKPDGTPVVEDFIISDRENKGVTSAGWGNLVATDGSDLFCAVWSEFRDGYSRIFLQRFNQKGEKIGSNIEVSSSTNLKDYYFPSIAATRDGYFLICYVNGNVFARVFHRDGYFTSEQIKLMDDPTGFIFPYASARGDTSFYVQVFGWNGVAIGEISKSGRMVQPMKMVTNPSGDTITVFQSQITNLRKGRLYLIFQKYIRNDTDIFFMPMNSQLQAVQDPVFIPQDSVGSWQSKPQMYQAPNGNVLVLWTDRRNGRYDLYGQLYGPDLQPIGANIKINDGEPAHWFANAYQATGMEDGSFLVAFTGAPSLSQNNFYLQKINRHGQKEGENILLFKNYWWGTPRIHLGYDPRDRMFFLVWYPDRSELDYAYLQRINENLIPEGSEKRFIRPAPYERVFYDFYISPDGIIYFTFQAYDTSSHALLPGLYVERYNSKGKEIFGIFSADTVETNQPLRAMATLYRDPFNFLLAWHDGYSLHVTRRFSIGKKVYFRKTVLSAPVTSRETVRLKILNYENRKSLVAYKISRNIYLAFLDDNRLDRKYFQLHHYPDPSGGTTPLPVAGADYLWHRLGLLFAYTSAELGYSGYDIWMKVFDASTLNFEPEPFIPRALADTLYPAYPNPFNAKTTIRYEVAGYVPVKLELYDVLGRRVAVLVDQPQDSGIYEYVLDASGFPSGIYFLRFQAFRTQIRKLILIR